LSEGCVFHAPPIERVREGMAVVDASGRTLGPVEWVKRCDPGAIATRSAQIAGRAASRADDIARVVAGDGREPDVPEPFRSQLLRVGFVKITEAPLVAADRYVPADQARAVAGATLTVGGALIEEGAR